MERRLAAIFAADVVGYSRLMGEDDVRTLDALKSLRKDLVAPKIAEHKGRVVKLMGDGLLAEFPSVVEAVECAVGIQNGMAEREPEISNEDRILLRIGINLGDIIIEGADIYGDGVNVAARLEGLADPGGICVSGTVFEHVKGKVDHDFADLGAQHVKNIKLPVQVYRIVMSGVAKTPGARGIVVGSGEASALPDKPSIAVLPFDNMSGDRDQEYFTDGITEDIITELSRFSGLFVIARHSSFAYKGQNADVRLIARELGVRYLLDGSIRRAGNRIRITAQLVDCATGNHIWAERYDRVVDDVFDLQEEITRNVVASIAPQIEMAEFERIRNGLSKSFSIYELALKAEAVLFDGIKSSSPEVLRQAIDVAEEVLAKDEKNVKALWTQGYSYHILCTWTVGSDTEALSELAWSISQRLSQIDSTNPYSCMIQGLICWDRGQYDQGLGHLRRGYSLNPNFAWNLTALAWCESLSGFTREAIEHAELSLRLSPRDMNFWLGTAYLAIAQAYFANMDFAKAKEISKLAVELDANAPIRRSLAVASCAHHGDIVEAARHLQALKSFAPELVASLLNGSYKLYTNPEHNTLLVAGIRNAEQPQLKANDPAKN